AQSGRRLYFCPSFAAGIFCRAEIRHIDKERKSSMELTTAIIIVASHHVQAVAVPLLQRYAPDTAVRVPPHITILFPFVTVERLGEAAIKLREVCAPIKPFDITMQGYDSFPGVAFMNPANPALIQAVFRKIYAAFPECPPYGGQFGHDLHPHM